MTTNVVETKEEKRRRMAAGSYVSADRAGKSCLRGKQVAPGQYVGRMPSSWRPETKRLHAHYRCIDQLREQVRRKAAALGIVVTPGGSVARG